MLQEDEVISKKEFERNNGCDEGEEKNGTRVHCNKMIVKSVVKNCSVVH